MRKIRTSKKGFTLAELLIVVAIIGVLVGISIPIFTTQLKKSRLATNQANARAAYAAATAAYLDDELVIGGTYNSETGVFTATKKAKASDTTTFSSTGTAAPSTTIKSWTVDNMGSAVYSKWEISFNGDAVNGIYYVES